MVVAPALAAGCSVVIKPPEAAPFACLRFGKLCEEAGLPPGVVNVVPGGPEAGDALVRHPGVDKISFVGGGAIGARIQAAAAESLTPLVLELGGKSAAIVFPDADLDIARPVRGRASPREQRSGLHDPEPAARARRRLRRRDRAAAAPRSRAVKVGDPFDRRHADGPGDQRGRRAPHPRDVVDRARSDGAARCSRGGERLGGSLADGWFLPPTVFGDVDPASELAQDEVFGPVLAVTRFNDEDEAVALANGTRYGLAAYVHHPATSIAALRVASDARRRQHRHQRRRRARRDGRRRRVA